MKGKFKFIMKAWCNTPSSVVMIIIWTILMSIYSWLGAKSTIFISKTIIDRDASGKETARIEYERNGERVETYHYDGYDV